eukprot:7217426-Pyramimonas_sp.AAC.1
MGQTAQRGRRRGPARALCASHSTTLQQVQCCWGAVHAACGGGVAHFCMVGVVQGWQPGWPRRVASGSWPSLQAPTLEAFKGRARSCPTGSGCGFDQLCPRQLPGLS